APAPLHSFPTRRSSDLQLFDTGDSSFSCTLSIGIATINETSTSADDCLENCLQAIATLHKSGGPGGNNAEFHEPVYTLSSPDMRSEEHTSELQSREKLV